MFMIRFSCQVFSSVLFSPFRNKKQQKTKQVTQASASVCPDNWSFDLVFAELAAVLPSHLQSQRKIKNALLNSYFSYQACHLYRLYLKRRRKNRCQSENKGRKPNIVRDQKSIIFVSHRRGIYKEMPSSFHYPNTRLPKNSGKRPDPRRQTSETC